MGGAELARAVDGATARRRSRHRACRRNLDPRRVLRWRRLAAEVRVGYIYETFTLSKIQQRLKVKGFKERNPD